MEDGSYKPATGRKLAALLAWDRTRPGLQQRLRNRKARLARLDALGAPEIILEDARRLVRETEAKLNP